MRSNSVRVDEWFKLKLYYHSSNCYVVFHWSRMTAEEAPICPISSEKKSFCRHKWNSKLLAVMPEFFRLLLSVSICIYPSQRRQIFEESSVCATPAVFLTTSLQAYDLQTKAKHLNDYRWSAVSEQCRSVYQINIEASDLPVMKQGDRETYKKAPIKTSKTN